MREPLIAAALVAVLAAAPARAVFVSQQMDRVDPEGLFDSEYFLDLRSFDYPADWRRLWSSSANGYRVNGASLDCCSLLLSQELRFEKKLTSGLSFRFRFEQSADKDRQETHHWLELEQTLWRGLSAAVVGEPTFNKEDADIGFGLAWRGAAWSASARRLFVDWNFNQRNSTTQRYDKLPLTDQFALAAHGGRWRWESSVEVDHPLRRRVPDQNRLFSYRRTSATTAWTLQRESWSPRAEYSYEYERKSDATLAYRREVHAAALSAAVLLGQRDELEAGQSLLARSARAEAPGGTATVSYRRWEAQPYARWRRRLKPWLVSELAGFTAAGENRQLRPGGSAPDQLSVIGEAKLGAGLDFVFGPAGRIGLYTSFDLDEAGSHFWDGGNARAMFFF